MLVTGDFIDAATAVDYGLINHSVSATELEARVMSMARKIAAKPAAALGVGKQLFYDQLPKSLPDAYELASEVMACNMLEAETIEYVDAFLEKRPARPLQ